jgi:hypothetical protein
MSRIVRVAFIAVCLLFSCCFLISTTSSAQGKCTTDSQSGVKVCQITSDGSNRLGYYDTPLYSAVYNKITYLKKPDSGPPQVAIANLDGSGEELVAVGMDPVFSPDGKKIYYISRSSATEHGMDLFAYDLGTHLANRITQVRASRLIEFTPAAHTAKGNLLVYSAGNVAYMIYDDGTGNTQLDFDDPYKDDTFHRIRISPTHPNLIFFNRNHRGGSLHPLFSYDTETKKTYHVTDQATHQLWMPDGIHIAYNGGPDYHFHIIKYDGTEDREVDPIQREGTAYCTNPPDGDDVFACANFDTTGHYPMPGSIFILASDGSNRVAFVCLHNSKQETFWGEPALHYVQDRYHIAFRSDATGEVQIYVAELPKDFYSRLKAPGGEGKR